MYFQESFQDNVLHVVGVQGDLNGHHTQEAPPLFDGEFYAVQSPQSGDEEGYLFFNQGSASMTSSILAKICGSFLASGFVVRQRSRYLSA